MLETWPCMEEFVIVHKQELFKISLLLHTLQSTENIVQMYDRLVINVDDQL